ncbi:MAG: alpha-glucan family phosphorylase, partial [Acidobacteria bacterium]|nr:alpha-glucan family phosphorylase [Acidobacteriota bacterium]
MKPVHLFNVIPALPGPIEGLRRVALNLRWAWHHDAIELFRRLDTDLWEFSQHNPVYMLGAIDQEQLAAAAADETFLAHLERVQKDLDGYLARESTWFQRSHGPGNEVLAAYFSAEFGLSECLSIFAGGLGVLAGDHLKAASDLGVPLVGVGLLYQQGYFRQYLSAAGWQQEAYQDNDFYNLPLIRQKVSGEPLLIHLLCGGNRILAQVWRAEIGRIPLYLLDTNLAANRPEDRDITDQLYGGDLEMRIKQEILLGIGGYRALEALGLNPPVFHMNEGHSAFLGLERIRRLMETHGLSFTEARELASTGLIFTTHTPVAAGHDYFPALLMDRYFADYARGLGLSRNEFLGLGRKDPRNEGEEFCMTVLALRLASASNAVSELHGQVSRNMWKGLWPGLPEEEVPIGHVTNGVHLRSWISYEMNQLYDRYLGPQWRESATPKLWQRVESIPAEELWRTHERRRERLVAFARRRLRTQLKRRGASPAEVDAADEVLDPEALTIGFARRFASYKRATLLLRDVERLGRILNNSGRPVQILYAGKAHPRDEAGKELIRQIVSLARRDEFRRRIVFLEDYDMAVARYMVQGCDVWLNTPLRPLEASGTSGMKAVANGALNVSVLDGWWDEAWRLAGSSAEPPGWAVGRGETYDNPEFQDQLEAEALYDLLEGDVVPTFYERRADGLPRRWIARMKSSVALFCPLFNTQRMVQQYSTGFYLPAQRRFLDLGADGCARAKALAAWSARVRLAWKQVRVSAIENGRSELPLGAQLRVRTWIHLGDLGPDDVSVQLYMGKLSAAGELIETVSFPM